MHNPNVDKLLDTYPLISDQVDKTELRVILRELASAQQRHAGAVVEFGCYIGTTSVFIRRLLDTVSPNVPFHVYDSFEGLPDKSGHDLSPAGEQFKTGELSASRKAFELQFKKSQLKLPAIHKGWFSGLTEKDTPPDISFAYLDGDYYESIKDSLRVIEAHLSPGATIVVDDYANEALPGAARAVDEWVARRAASLRVESSLAIIRL